MSRAKICYIPHLGDMMSKSLQKAETKWATKSGSALFDPKHEQIWGAQINTGIKNIAAVCDNIDIVKLGDWFDNKDYLTDYEIKLGNTVRTESEIVDILLLVKSNSDLTESANAGNASAFFDVMFEVDVCENNSSCCETLVLRCKRYLQFQYTRSSNTIRWLNNVRNNSLTMCPIAPHLIARNYKSRVDVVAGMNRYCLLDGYIAHPIHPKLGFEPELYDVMVPLHNMIL